MKSDQIPQSGKKQSGESTGLPKQNSRSNLNDSASGVKQGSMSPASGSAAEKGYTRENM